jgi:hypothetical protein
MVGSTGVCVNNGCLFPSVCACLWNLPRIFSNGDRVPCRMEREIICTVTHPPKESRTVLLPFMEGLRKLALPRWMCCKLCSDVGMSALGGVPCGLSHSDPLRLSRVGHRKGEDLSHSPYNSVLTGIDPSRHTILSLFWKPATMVFTNWTPKSV